MKYKISNMKELICQIFLLSLATCSKLSMELKWEDFKLKFQKGFRGYNHELERKSVFEENVVIIENHNTLFENGISSYKMDINQYSDMTFKEFQDTVLMHNGIKFDDTTISKNLKPNKTSIVAPSKYDWREEGILNAVKDQGHCGSCWAFAVVGSVEAAWARSGNELLSLSEQELIDCGEGDCNGGAVYAGYETIIRNGGEMLETDYPYEAKEGQCRYDPAKKKAYISSYEGVTNGHVVDAEIIADSVYDNGPNVAALWTNANFQHYSSGIFDDPSCLQSDTNHVVVIVGYSKDEQYWIIRNSWGQSWGEDGHIRIKLGKNMCNVEHYVSYPIV